MHTSHGSQQEGVLPAYGVVDADLLQGWTMQTIATGDYVVGFEGGERWRQEMCATKKGESQF